MTAPSGSPCDLSHGVGVRQGKKVMTTLLRHRRSRRQPSFGQISPLERPLRCARSGCDHMENVATRRNRRNPAMQFRARAPITTGKLTAFPERRRTIRLQRLCRVAGISVHWIQASREEDVLCLACRRPIAAPSPFSTITQVAPGCPGPPVHHRPAQAVAMPCPEASGVANADTRTNAMMRTAAAPMMEKTNCQVSDGMVCSKMPRVA